MTKAVLPFVLLASVLLLSGVVKGQVQNGHLAYQFAPDTSPGTPYEASNSNSRYVLVEAIIKNRTFFFDNDQAALATPDLVRYRGRYFSIFTPGVSFLALPFYWLGQKLGLPQLLTFSLNLLLAILNLYLVYRLSRKLGSSQPASIICGFLFVFATSALAYSLSLTQHQLSTFLLLLGLGNSLASRRNILNNAVFGFLLGTALLVDVPNLFMFLPLGVYIFCRHFKLSLTKSRTFISVSPAFLAILVTLLPLLAVFGWYNYQLTGRPTLLGQTIGRTNYLPQAQNEPPSATTSSGPQSLALHPRSAIRGLSVLVLSVERSWWYYSPFLLLATIGVALAVKNPLPTSRHLAILALSVIAIIYATYSMFGDPWGGWAFGPRYLIPAAALASILVSAALTKFGRRPLFALLFVALSGYSLYVNSLGALTTSLVPPKVEVDAMPDPIPYTYRRNQDLLEAGLSGSVVYSWLFSGKISAKTYFWYYTSFLWVAFAGQYLLLLTSSSHDRPDCQ